MATEADVNSAKMRMFNSAATLFDKLTHAVDTLLQAAVQEQADRKARREPR